MFPWTVPDEIVSFIYNHFECFREVPPSEKAIDTIADFVIDYVVDNKYFPATAQEAIARYEQPGMSEPEKHQILGPLEVQLKLNMREDITIGQIHLAAWAALFYLWSEEGMEYVDWYSKINVGEEPDRQVDEL